MKKFNFLKSFLLLVFFGVGINYSIAQETLALWTFDKWTGGDQGSPQGQLLTDPISADEGLNAATAKIGNENMFIDGEQGTVRSWGLPSSGGYVRTSDMIVGTYYRIIGISTVGNKTIKVSGNFGSDSSSRPYYLQLEYRIGSSSAWIPVGIPINIASTSTSSMPAQFDNVEVPEACNNVAALELRFVVTSLGGATAQARISNILISGTKIPTGLSSILNDNVKVFSSNGKIAIKGAAGAKIEIYNLTGAKVMELQNLNENEAISIPAGQIYIVKVNSVAYKIKL